MRLGKLRYESKYLAIKHFHETKGWIIEWMCSQLEISRAAYYKWMHRKIPLEEQENVKLAGLIREYDEHFHHILGYRRMTSWINHFNHTNYGKNRVHRIMKNPNQKWSTDVTEFKVPGEKKKLYLSMILDLYDRYPVSYVISSRNDNKLVFKTFDKAISENPGAKPVFHSDRGYQYTGRVFQGKLKEQQMEPSMSRVGHCIDNGPTEGLWGIIKSEMYQMYEITDECSLRHAIKGYIKFYSEERPQDRYHCKTPLEVRTEAMTSDQPMEYPIPKNKRIEKYKEKWCA